MHAVSVFHVSYRVCRVCRVDVYSSNLRCIHRMIIVLPKNLAPQNLTPTSRPSRRLCPFLSRRLPVQLLNANVGLPPPNMAHFLLGFKSSRRNARRHGSATYLSGYSCLHIIVNRLLETHYTDLYPRHGEEMAELIYRLCTDKKMVRAIVCGFVWFRGCVCWVCVCVCE